MAKFDSVNPPLSELAQRASQGKGSRFVNEAVPFVEIGGRCALTDKQLMEQPWLLDFLRCFPHCFERDERLCCYFYLEGVSSQ